MTNRRHFILLRKKKKKSFELVHFSHLHLSTRIYRRVLDRSKHSTKLSLAIIN